jgi:hypothetical protein
LNVQRIFGHLNYIGKARGKRQEYSIFSPKNSSHFLMFTRNGKMSGNYSLVSSDSVEKVATVFKNTKGVTTQNVSVHKLTKKICRQRFAALGCLYVLVAQKRAKVDLRRKGRSIFFNVY